MYQLVAILQGKSLARSNLKSSKERGVDVCIKADGTSCTSDDDDGGGIDGDDVTKMIV